MIEKEKQLTDDELIRKAKAEYQREWASKNEGYHKAYKKKWNEENKDKLAAHQKKWRENNKDKKAEQNRNYWLKKANEMMENKS